MDRQRRVLGCALCCVGDEQRRRRPVDRPACRSAAGSVPDSGPVLAQGGVRGVRSRTLGRRRGERHESAAHPAGGVAVPAVFRVHQRQVRSCRPLSARLPCWRCAGGHAATQPARGGMDARGRARLARMRACEVRCAWRLASWRVWLICSWSACRPAPVLASARHGADDLHLI